MIRLALIAVLAISGAGAASQVPELVEFYDQVLDHTDPDLETGR